MKTIEIDKLIGGLEWESRRGHYTTEGRMALLNELKAMKEALNIDLVSKSLISEYKDENPTIVKNILYEFTDHKTSSINEVDFEDVVKRIIEEM